MFGFRFYRWFVLHHVPIIGGWLRRRSAKKIARSGGPIGLLFLMDCLFYSDDDRVRAAASRALSRLTDSDVIDQICAMWWEDRDPHLEKILVDGKYIASRHPLRLYTALKVGRARDLIHLSEQDVAILAVAVEDSDQEIAEQAALLAGKLESEDARTAFGNAVANQWAQNRSPVLEQIVVTGEIVSQNYPATLLTRLKLNKLDEIITDTDERVTDIADLCSDSDPVIAANAVTVLSRVAAGHQHAKVIGEVFLKQDLPQLATALVEQGYAPTDEADRALFLFLTEQWDRYDIVDFDRRYLVGIYQSADAVAKKRIIEKLRASGRTEHLNILAGRGSRSRLAEVSIEEADVLIQMLSNNQEWPRLWKLLFELRLPNAVRIMRILAQAPWQPLQDDERGVHSALSTLSAEPWTITDQDIKNLPPIVERARAMVPGRVNDVDFAPHKPWILVGTGKRRIIVWDYQQAKGISNNKGSFSISNVTFLEDGAVLAAEKIPGNVVRNKVHLWQGDKQSVLTFSNKVTAMRPWKESTVLVSLRNGSVLLYDLQEEKIIREKRFTDWTREIQVSPDEQRCVLMQKGLTVLRLEDFTELCDLSASKVVSQACFTEKENEMLVGWSSGEVHQWDISHAEPYPEVLTHHPGGIRGIELLFNRTVLMTACSQGIIRFSSWPGMEPRGEIQLPGERLTSLNLSHTGDHLAVGDSDETIALWDLRALSGPRTLQQPFAKSLPLNLPAIRLLAEAESLPTATQKAMQFARTVLQHKFRYDIHIEEVASIQQGTYDIEIEG